MIVTKQKEKEQILSQIEKFQSFFMIGCSECATLCETGSEEVMLKLKEWLESMNKSVTGWFIAKTGCQILGTRSELNKFKKELENAQCILALSCGAGTQTLVELFEDKAVIPVNDTLFIGNMRRLKEFEEKCRACGECLLAITGVCVVTLCPKSMLNGPCGGYRDGKCEVFPNRRCVWIVAYSILERRGLVEMFYETILGPKDWSKSVSPRYHKVKER